MNIIKKLKKNYNLTYEQLSEKTGYSVVMLKKVAAGYPISDRMKFAISVRFGIKQGDIK